MAEPACTLTSATQTAVAGSQVRLAWNSTDASSGAWIQNEAAGVLGLSGDRVGPRGWLDVAVGDGATQITPTLRMGPARPRLEWVSTVNLGNFSNAIGIEVADGYAYVVDGGIGHQLDVVDISNPAAPIVVGAVSDLFRLNGAFTVRKAGRYLYVTATGSGRLEIIDTARPTAPAIVAELVDARLAGARGLFLAGRYAYVVGNAAGALSIIDIADPLAPRFVGSIIDPIRLAGADSVVAAGRYAYVTVGDRNALLVIDIANPAAPVIVGELVDGMVMGNPKELIVRNGLAYVTGLTSDSIAIVSVSVPSAPVLVGSLIEATLLDGAKNLHLSGDYAYVTANSGNRVTMVDIADPRAPAIAGSILDVEKLQDPRGIVVVGSDIFVAAVNRLNVLRIREGAADIGTCSAAIAVTGGSPARAATLDSVTANGTTTIGGTATQVDAVRLILHLPYDPDMTAYTNVEIPVTGGRWSIALPLSDGAYEAEVHAAAPRPSAATFLAWARLTVSAGQR